MPGTSKVFELPLHAQDTAMLYTDRMGVSEAGAIELCGKLIEDVKDHGGALTVNWHDRSMSPERNWDSAYLAIMGMLRMEKTWFAKASETVAWFEKRRAVRFEWALGASIGFPKVMVPASDARTGPPLALRVHRAARSANEPVAGAESFADYPLYADTELPVGH
jgi:hypothetical protein